MNSKIFSSINDRMNIANAYSNICESTSRSKIIESDTAQQTIKEDKPSVDLLTYLITKYPNISDENLIKIEDTIVNYIHADDCEEFIFTLKTNVEFDIENDGIGIYDYGGHDEYDAGHDYPVATDTDTLGEQHESPDGTSFETYSSDDEINERLCEEASDGLEWEDEDGRGRYHSFDIFVNFILKVDNPVEFDDWLLKTLKDSGQDVSFLYDDSSLNDEEKDLISSALKESVDEIEWQGRGKNVEWSYVDILKDTKAFMDIKTLVGKTRDQIFNLNFRADNPSQRAEIYSKIQLLLNDIESITNKFGINEISAGHRELLRDVEQAEKLGLLD